MKFRNEEELLNYTETIKGKTFKEIDSKGLLENNSMKRRKGLPGQIVETGFYKYSLNNTSEADFKDLGIELKVTGFIRNKNSTIRAKERLVLGKIDYNNLVHETYENSHLIDKNKKLLIIWYEYEKGKPLGEFQIKGYQLYDMSQDEEVFKNDFNIIKEKVKKGLAHELSEGDTSYLGACTKGATSKDRTTQPYSEISAKPRAFALKNSYMTALLRDSINTNILKQTNSKIVDAEEYIYEKIKPFLGKTQIEIYEEITGDKITGNIPKNINKKISDILIGKDKELPEKDDIFKKTSFIIKNIPVNENKPLERMSFKTLRLIDFEDEWDDSYWKLYFEETTFLLICYDGKSTSKNGYRKLKGVKKVTFNEKDLDSFKLTYNQVKQSIEQQDFSLMPTPKSFDGQILEIAPKGQKGDDAYNNFFKEDKTKVAFMMTKEFIKNKLNKST